MIQQTRMLELGMKGRWGLKGLPDFGTAKNIQYIDENAAPL